MNQLTVSRPVMLQESNFTKSRAQECHLKPTDILLIAGYIAVIVIGLGGNILVLAIFRSKWKKGSIIELLICYLAVFDALSSFFGPSVFMYWTLVCWKRWDFGWVGCKIFPYLFRVFTTISAGIILIMAVDRCRLILFPVRRRFQRKTIHISIFATVLISFLWESYYANAVYVNKYGICTVLPVNSPSYAYPLIVLTLMKIAIFVLVFLSTTVAVYLKLCRCNKTTLLKKFPNKQPTKDLKVMKMIVTIAIVFILSVVPRDALHLLYTISWMPGNTGIRGR